MKYLAVLSLFLFACRKSGQPPGLPAGNYFICSINGVRDTFSVQYAQKEYDSLSPGGTTTALSIIGSHNTMGTNVSFTINNFPSHDSITVGSYWDSSANFLTSGEYFITTGNYYDAGTSFYWASGQSDIPMQHHLEITIKHLDNTTVTGIFSGDFYYGDDYVNGARATITDGIFSVPVQP
jgi:hypothetical protein